MTATTLSSDNLFKFRGDFRPPFPFEQAVDVDFETRSLDKRKLPQYKPVDLKKVGMYRYCMDKNTRVNCVTWEYPNGEKYTWRYDKPFENLKPLSILFKRLRGGLWLKGHNVEFEYCVFKYVFRKQLAKLLGKNEDDFYCPQIWQLLCSAAEAAAMNLPRALANVCKVLRTPVQKDLVGAATMKKCAKPRKPTKNNPSVWNTTPEAMDITVAYNIDDVGAEKSASKKLPRLSESELALFHETVAMNERGLRIDVKKVKTANRFVTLFFEEKKQVLSDLSNGELHSVKQTEKFKKWLAHYGYEIKNLQAETVENSLLDKKLKGKARQLLELRQLLAKSSILKYATMVESVCDDGRLRGLQLFYGAQATGRWAGKGTQPHNFVKSSDPMIPTILDCLDLSDYKFFKTIFPDVQTALANVLRAMIIPEKGRTFYDWDWNAIEARIAAILAGDKPTIRAYRKNEDLYRILAAAVFGIDPGDVSKDQRQKVGKPGVLGSGFGMGWKKFAKQYDMDPKLAHKVITTWRKRHKTIVDFWGELHSAACTAIENPGQVTRAGKFIRFQFNGKILRMRLPSGRCLVYQRPAVQWINRKIRVETPYTDENGETQIKVKVFKRRTRSLLVINYKGASGFYKELHGGHLLENCCQAIARDFLKGVILRFINEKRPSMQWVRTCLVLLLHDEGLAEVPIGSNIDEFLKLIGTTEKWAKGWPLKINFWENERFGCHDETRSLDVA